jgi:anti-sigma B factor antagonist
VSVSAACGLAVGHGATGYRETVFAAEPSSRGSWQVLHVTGDVDLASAPAFRRALVQAVEPASAGLVVDLTACHHLDSVGVGLLLGALKRTRAHGGTLRLVASDDRILRVLELTELTRIVAVHPTLAGALDAAPSAPAPAGAE